MPAITIRQVEPGELRAVFFPMWTYAFRSSLEPVADYDALIDEMFPCRAERYTAVLFEDAAPVAAVQAMLMEQNIRGRLLPMAGVCGVVTRPESRNNGYSKRLLQHLFTDLRAAGYAVSALYPFRESFYERVGYVSYPQVREAVFAPEPLTPLLSRELPGEIDVISLWDGWQTYRGFLNHLRTRIHGMALPIEICDRQKFGKGQVWLAVARLAGEIVGMMTYQITQFAGDFRVHHFYYTDPAGRYLMLRWMARHIDQVKTITIRLMPSEHPETWLADMAVRGRSWNWYTPMGRVLNIEGLGDIPVGPGDFTARIIDPMCDWNQGIFRFGSRGGMLQVTPAAEPECALSIQALSALVHGTHDPADFTYRGWGDLSPGMQVTMRSMFPRALPFLYADY